MADVSEGDRVSDKEERGAFSDDTQGRMNVTLRRKMRRTEMMERIETLEEFVGSLNHIIQDCMRNQERMTEEIQEGRKEQERLRHELQTALNSQDRMNEEIRFLRTLITSGAMNGSGGSSSSFPKVKEPETYNGARDDRVLGNFFWDMEEYLEAMPSLSDEMQVKTAARYLTGSAKLWWRTRVEDKIAGKDIDDIESWAQLKEALKEQFLPGNSAWVARKKLLNLKQTGSISEYIKAYTSLMLEIKEMTDDDRLFNFMKGLQPWAQEEISRRRHIKTVAEAIKEADGLMDFRVDKPNKPPSPPRQRNNENNERQARFVPWSNQRPRTTYNPPRGPQGWFQPRGYFQNRSFFGNGGGWNGGYGGRPNGGYGGRPNGGNQRGAPPRVNFQAQNRPEGTNQKRNDFRCYICDQTGHIAPQCPRRLARTEITSGDDGAGPSHVGAIGSGFATRAGGTKEDAEMAKLLATVSDLYSSQQKDKGVLADPDYSVTDRELDSIIVESKCVKNGKSQRYFQVKWKDDDEATWEQAERLWPWEDKVNEFLENYSSHRFK